MRDGHHLVKKVDIVFMIGSKLSRQIQDSLDIRMVIASSEVGVMK